jgi:hypothetical protein
MLAVALVLAVTSCGGEDQATEKTNSGSKEGANAEEVPAGFVRVL